MATLKELEAAFIAADDAGEVEDAAAFADEIRRLRSSKPAQRPLPMKTPAQAAMEGAKRGATDVASGLVRGAGSIGSTMVSPGDYIADLMLGQPKPGVSRNEMRRQAIDQGLAYMTGANPESGAYQTGKVISEVAGTLGIPVAAGRAVGTAAPAAGRAIAAGGMVPGAPIAGRVAGGLTAGGLTAGAINPDDAGVGAVVGGGLPLVAPVVGPVARKAGGLASEVLGLSTGAGSESVRQAARAGLEGGERAASFTANMRGQAPMTDALDIAKANLDAMRAAKNAQYRSGMVDIRADKAVIDFADVDNALADAANVTLYKGQVKNAKAESVREEIAKAVDEWRSLDPAEFHTPEGFDALKQRIGAIVESIPMEERTAGKVGKDIYNAVKNAINKQAPTYAKVMQDYTQAADDIAQAEKALSLGKKASVDTAMRKLQSLTRNNVNTNYGNRLSIAEQLQRQGGQDFMPALSGQALSSVMPRGLQGVVATGAGAAGYLQGGLPGISAAIPVLMSQSPRVVGEAAYGAGAAGRYGESILDQIMKSRAAPAATVSLLDLISNRGQQ